jgi:hypothetical protein
MANRRIIFALIPLITSFLLSGCLTLPDPETSQEVKREFILAEYRDGVTIGQTIKVKRARLNGLTFWVHWQAPDEAEQAWVRVRLFLSLEKAAQGDQPIHSNQISIRDSGPINLSLLPRPESAGQEYYLELTPSDASVLFQGQNVDAYGGGTAYVDGTPISGDLAFRTTYEFDIWAALSDLQAMATKSWLLIPLAMVLLAPGWLVMNLSGLRRRFDAGEQIALSLGLSLALVPLLMLWTSMLGLRWSSEFLLVTAILLALAVLWQTIRGSRPARFDWTGLMLIGVFIFSLAVRLMMVRDLVAPAWVDPVHHALITRLILEGGALPSSYSPYLQLGPTVYHAGFHSGLAAFIRLSGLDLPEGMLVYGQVLNAACIFAVYLLTTLLSGDRRAGLGAALICGLFTPMPAYYVSWGRYTQLAGLLILPVGLAFIQLIFEGETKHRQRENLKHIETPGDEAKPEDDFARPSLLLVVKSNTPGKWIVPLAMACLSTAGLLLVHYRASAFLACLLLAYSASLFFDRRRLSQPMLGASIQQLLATGSLLILGALILTLPWMGEIIRDRLLPALSRGHVLPAEPFADFSWRFLEAGYGVYTLWLAGAGLLFGLVFRKRFVVALVLWVSMLFGLANLNALGLPGGEVVNNTSVAITLFMPVALLGGFAASCLILGGEWLLHRGPTWSRLLVPFRGGLVVVGLALSFAGARQLFPLVNQSTYLFRSADRPALSWIEQNISQDEVILINPFNWGYGLCAGNDGGAWINALSGQPTQPPPVIYGFGDPGEIQRVNSLCVQVMQHGGNPDELWALMRDAGLRYLYIGVRGGPISPTAVLASPLFDTLYAEGGAYVFRSLGW